MRDVEWRRVPLWSLVTTNDEVLAETTAPDLEFDYVDISAVTQGSLSDRLERVRFGDAPSRARRLARPGDVVMSTVRTYLRAVAPVRHNDFPRVYSTGFAVLRPRRDRVDSRFLGYRLVADDFMDQVEAQAVGVSYPAITAQQLAHVRLTVPSVERQRRIADYLDRETAAIDALIEKQRKVKKLGTARKQAVIDSAVASPEVLPLKRDAALVTSGPRGWAQFYASSGQRFIRITDIQRDSIKLGDQSVRYVDAPDAGEAQRASTRVGDLVVSITADLGSVGLIDKAHAGAVVSQHVAIVRLAGRHWVSRFAAYALKSSPLKDQFAGAAYGGTKVQLSLGDVRDLEVPAPPLPEQRAIANQLDRETAKIDALIAKAERFIELAQERRAALITAAVTGQLEIPAEESAA